MSDNLYAPPAADVGTGPAAGAGTGDFDFGRVFSEAWANTWANFPLWLGVIFVWMLAAALATVTVIGVVAALPVLGWGLVYFHLRMHDGGAEFGDAFAGFRRYGKALVDMLVCTVVLIVVSFLGQLPAQVATFADSGWLAAVGFLVNLAVTFLVMPRLLFSWPLTVDRGVSGGEAVSLAWARTPKLMWKLALLQLLTSLVVVVGVLALVVGVFPAMVMSYLMWVSAYRQIFGGPQS
jgi:hypothetical protein